MRTDSIIIGMLNVFFFIILVLSGCFVGNWIANDNNQKQIEILSKEYEEKIHQLSAKFEESLQKNLKNIKMKLKNSLLNTKKRFNFSPMN